MGSGGGSRLLTDEKTDSSNLRDFLRIKEEDDNGRNSLSGLTLRAVLSDATRPARVQSNRTLLDIIRDEPTGGSKDSNKSWKSFKEKLHLRRAGASWTSTVSIPTSDVPIQQNTNRMMMRRHSTRIPAWNVRDPTPEGSSQPELSAAAINGGGEETRTQLSSVPSNKAMMLRRNSSRIPERQGGRLNRNEYNAAEELPLPSTEAVRDTEEEMEESVTEAAAEGEGEPQARMSLMALLAETDRQMGIDGSAYIMDDDEEEEDDDEEEEEEEETGGGGGGGEYNNCCVCMVRHKGAAFIPCGHTFCRLCSRELWVQRGNCPLCNNFILEILDIF